MNITIIQAQSADLDTVLDILEEAGQWLALKGINQWLPGSFRGGRRQSIANRLNQGEVYLAKRDGEAVGTLTLQWSDKLMWGDTPDDAGYVHSLAICHAIAGMSIGRQLLQWAENTAAAAGKRYLRLDCMAENAALRGYYAQTGFTYLREVEGKGWKASLYEKQITADS